MVKNTQAWVEWSRPTTNFTKKCKFIRFCFSLVRLLVLIFIDAILEQSAKFKLKCLLLIFTYTNAKFVVICLLFVHPDFMTVWGKRKKALFLGWQQPLLLLIGLIIINDWHPWIIWKLLMLYQIILTIVFILNKKC